MKIPPPDALKPRKTPSQARSAATVDAISKAAIQVLLDEGVRRLTMTRIAERAGVSVGTMYQYFPHKQALLYSLVEQHMTEYADTFQAACLQLHGQPVAAMSEGIVTAFVDTKLNQPDASRALYKIAGEFDTDDLRIDMIKRLQDACSALLASATDAKFADLADVSFTLLTAMNGTMKAMLERGTQANKVKILRMQLLALCRGYLLAVSNLPGLALPAGNQEVPCSITR
ncbi:TetR/AcrR family transcriptional regulator [Pseudomonas sp. Hz4]